MRYQNSFKICVVLVLMMIPTAIISSQGNDEASIIPDENTILLQPSSDIESIQQALTSENQCELPCFLGLYPGMTSGGDVLALAPLDFEPDNQSNYVSRFVNMSKDENDAPLFVLDLAVDDDILSQLTITIRDANEWLPANTIDLPSLLALQIDEQPEIFMHVHLTLFHAGVYVYYSEPEMLFQYRLQLDVVGDVFSGTSQNPLLLCPTIDNHDFARFRLRSQNIAYDNTLFDLYLEQFIEEHDLLWDVERMIGLDAQAFQTQIVENPNECLELPSIAEFTELGQ